MNELLTTALPKLPLDANRSGESGKAVLIRDGWLASEVANPTPLAASTAAVALPPAALTRDTHWLKDSPGARALLKENPLKNDFVNVHAQLSLFAGLDPG